MRRQEQHVCEMVRPTTVKRMVWCTVFYVRGVKECACLRKPHFSSDSYLDRRKRTLFVSPLRKHTRDRKQIVGWSCVATEESIALVDTHDVL